tara:strand:+ start:8466 stop:8654 length:189 start_codon:yes stop_codon:yes gene_type:complete
LAPIITGAVILELAMLVADMAGASLILPAQRSSSGRAIELAPVPSLKLDTEPRQRLSACLES